MARNTAAQGREFEHSVIHYLGGCDCETVRARPVHIGWRGFGYSFIRSAASKGAVDMVAVPPRELVDQGLGHTLYIQCKLSNPVISPAERKNLRDLAYRSGALPIVSWRQVDQNNRRKRPHFRLLTGDGPKDFVPWEP